MSYNCERPCTNPRANEKTELILITGGPGAGKTAMLEYVRKLLCDKVAILPEAAGILFGGGFWRLPSPTAKKAAQLAIYHVQEQLQNLVIAEKSWYVGLCDRGTLDGLAYWPDSDATYFQALNTNRLTEYAKYKAVIHLHSPTADLGYNHQNPIRIETAQMAGEIDQRIELAWRDHPHYCSVGSAVSFKEKVATSVQILKTFLPPCCRI